MGIKPLNDILERQMMLLMDARAAIENAENRQQDVCLLGYARGVTDTVIATEETVAEEDARLKKELEDLMAKFEMAVIVRIMELDKEEAGSDAPSPAQTVYEIAETAEFAKDVAGHADKGRHATEETGI